MKYRARLRLLLGAALAAGLLTGAAAATPPPGFPSPNPGQTTVGVQTADTDQGNLSFTVPLYLTVAATQDGAGNAKVVVPEEYRLRNTTGSAPDGTYPDIAVTGVAVQGVAGGDWSMTDAPAGPRDISLSIGKLALPTVPAGDTAPVPATIMASDNDFYDPATGRFKPILGGPGAVGMNLSITGQLAAGYTPTSEKAAAQFRVAYTVSLLDGSGKPIGQYYDGPTLEQAAAPATPSPAAPSPAGP